MNNVKNEKSKWNIPGISNTSLKMVKEDDRKDFMLLMGKLYLRSSEECVIEEIFNKAFKVFVREKLFKDGILEMIVKYSYDNNLNSFNKNGTLNKKLIKHILNNTKKDNILYNYFINNNFFYTN